MDEKTKLWTQRIWLNRCVIKLNATKAWEMVSFVNDWTTNSKDCSNHAKNLNSISQHLERRLTAAFVFFVIIINLNFKQKYCLEAIIIYFICNFTPFLWTNDILNNEALCSPCDWKREKFLRYTRMAIMVRAF